MVGKNINDLCGTKIGDRGHQVAFLKMNMSMQVVPGLCPFDQPVDGAQAAVGSGIFIMDAERRRVGDKDVWLVPVFDAVICGDLRAAVPYGVGRQGG